MKKKDKVIADLREQLVERESKMMETVKKQKTAEEDTEKARQEVQEMERVLQSNQEEMAALHEQLTQVWCREREEGRE